MALTMLLSPSMDCVLYLGHGDLQNEPPIFFQKSILSFFWYHLCLPRSIFFLFLRGCECVLRQKHFPMKHRKGRRIAHP